MSIFNYVKKVLQHARDVKSDEGESTPAPSPKVGGDKVYKPQGGSRPATSRNGKTNKQRCSHNAKVKRRRGNA